MKDVKEELTIHTIGGGVAHKRLCALLIYSFHKGFELIAIQGAYIISSIGTQIVRAQFALLAKQKC